VYWWVNRDVTKSRRELTRRSCEDEHPVVASARIPGVISAAFAAAALMACSNVSDPGIIEAAHSLVPPGSEITETNENTTGLRFETGNYRVILTVTDGGLEEDLLPAIEAQAAASGWQLTEREDIPAGIHLVYLRSDLRADVSVRTNNDPVTAAIRVERGR
jgi:hypothetical protein